MRTMQKLSPVLFILLSPLHGVAQTDGDGAMRIFHYTDYFYTDNDDDWGTDEHTWYYYRGEQASIVGGYWDQEGCWGWDCGGSCYGYPGWAFDRTYNQTTVPTQFRMRGRYWEDDGGGRCNENWYDDDYNNWEQQYNVRLGCPYVWSYYGWQGSYWRNVHYTRTYYSSPRPDYARINGVSGTYNQCGPGWLTLQTAGRQCSSSLYYWYRNGVLIGQTTSGSFSYYETASATYTVYTNDQGANSYWNHSVSVNISNPPTANAGNAINQCWSGGAFNITSGASATNYTSVSWQIIAGSGANLSNTSSLAGCTLTPTTDNGSVTVRLTTSSPGCPNATSQKTVSWNRAPFGNEGTPDPTEVCFSPNLGAIQMTNATKGGFSTTATWSTQGGSGTGTWTQNTNNPSLAVFTPSSDSGSRTMRMRVQATGGACNGQTADYFRIVNWNRLDANAGTPVSQCNTNNVTTAGASITGSYSSFSWSWIPQTGTAASAVITNTASLTGCALTNLTGAGSGILRLTVVGNAPCGTITRDKFVEWSASPAANAGGTLNVCSGAGNAIPMTGATGGGTTGNPTWSGGSGLGSWTNGGSDPASWTFTPNGSNPSGSFTATLEVVGVAPCAGTVTSTRTVSWSTPPVASAGGTLNSCLGSSPIVLSGASASGTYGSVSWTVVSGGGTFSGSGINPATYSYNPPSSSGTAIVRLTVNGNGANCSGETDSETRVINWDSMSASSPASITSCGTGVISMATSTATGAFSSLAWSGQSGGTWTLSNSTDPNWQFTPGAASGSFTATLTLTGSGACAGQTATSTTVVDWDEEPEVDAGSDILVCTGSGVGISMSVGGPTATGQISSVNWSSSAVAYGSGSWSGSGSDPSTWAFTPSTAEGYIVAQLQAVGSGNCTGNDPLDTRIIQWSTEPIISSVTVTDQTDCNNPNGALIVGANGQGTLTYSSDNGANFVPSDTILGIASGSYNVVVQDSIGCLTSFSANPVTVGGPTPVVLSSVTVTQQNNCAGLSEGELTIAGVSGGGGAPYSYTITGSGGRVFDLFSDPFVVDSLLGATYEVSVFDQFGCESNTINVTLSDPPSIVISNISVTDINGCGGSGAGAISLTASGGTGTLNYYLNGSVNTPATNSTFNGLNAGSYEVEVRDATGCAQFARATITAPWYPTAGNNLEVCSGSTVQLNGGIVGQALGCIVAGTGTASTPSCAVVSSAGCSDGDGLDNFSTSNGIANISRTGTGCNGNSNGYVDYADIVEVNAGNSFDFSLDVIQYDQGVRIWIDLNNNGTFEAAESVWDSSPNAGQSFSGTISIPNGTQAGVYRMRVRTAYLAIPTADAGACGSIQYSETEDYRVKVNGIGACSPTYSWSPTTGLSNANIADPTIANPSSNTTYTLTVNDGNGCVQTAMVNVNVSDLSTTAAVDNVSCNGDDDGCVTITPTDGIGPYLLYASTGDVQVWGGRMRTVTVTNPNATALTNHQVEVNVPWAATMRSDFGDIRFFDANQNPVPYWVESYTLSTTAKFWLKVPSVPASGSATIYMVYGNNTLATQSNGDAVFEFFDDFDAFDAATWSATGDYTMFNGRMNVTSGSVYSNNTVASQPDMMVEAKVNWANFINSYSGLNISNTQGTQGNNNGGSRIAYLMSDAGAPTNGIRAWSSNTAGSYNLTGGGILQFTANTATDYILGYDLTASGMNFYNNRTLTQAFSLGSWANPFHIYLGYFTGSAAGTVDISDISVDWVLVRKKAASLPTVSLGPVVTADNAFCGLEPNTYTIDVVDVASCTDSETEAITEPDVLVISSIDVTNTWCYNNAQGALDITVAGGTPNYVYNWAGPSGFSSNNADNTGLAAGIYNVTVADDNACTASSSATVGTATPITAPSFTWTGMTDQLWQDPTNWDCGVPDATSDVIIPAAPIGGNTPLITGGIIGEVFRIRVMGNVADLLKIDPDTNSKLKVYRP